MSGALEVAAILRARESVLKDAYMTVKLAQPAVFGGITRHKFLALQAKAAWLNARLAFAENLVALRQAKSEELDPEE